MHSTSARALLGALALTVAATVHVAAQTAPAMVTASDKMPVGPAGMFHGGMGHTSAGMISISGSGKERKLDFSDNFVVDKVADVEVVLAHSMDGKDGLSLGKLKYNTGAQSYKIPESVDLASYSTVLLWVKKSGSLVAAASLPGDMMSHGAMKDTMMKKN